MSGYQDFFSCEQFDERFSQLQKMEAIGRLAGGVAHDFNNLLTVINSYCEILLVEKPAEVEARNMIAQIRQAGERAAKLTRQLLVFSRKQRIQPVVVNLNSVVSNMVIMLQRLIGENVDFTTNLDPSLPSVKADPGQIEQVIMNLAVNSRDAMPKGGELSIATSSEVVESDHDSLRAGIPPGSYVKLTVRDTGSGMDKQTMSHLFEPFFTTKEPGKGTGLGLATVYGIVKQNGGFIKVESRLGLGTGFRIYFPQTKEASTVVPDRPRVVQKPSNKETILLVEDDKEIRSLATRILQANEYTVLQAKNGLDAVAQASRYHEPIHLLISDVIMPFMSGPVLAKKLLLSRPKIKVVYMSGYTDSFIAQQDEESSDMILLEKPFTPDGLMAMVKKVLDQSPATVDR